MLIDRYSSCSNNNKNNNGVIIYYYYYGTAFVLFLSLIIVVVDMNSYLTTNYILPSITDDEPIVDVHNDVVLVPVIEGTKQQQQQQQYIIFYNAYVNPENVEHSIAIIREQLKQWQESRYANVTLYYTHIGDITSQPFPCPINGHCELLQQKSIGWEEDTLMKLQEYCQHNLDHNVIYLHSKGSFRPSEENNRLRRLITSAALSDECYIGITKTQCNICSARFSPLPHWHTPGNMWTTQCKYIHQLYPIQDFERKVSYEVVQQYLNDCLNCYDWSVGTGRYANEHWVHTHPNVNPCDVYPNTSYIYGYPILPDSIPPLTLEMAPRIFPSLQSAHFINPIGPQIILRYRLLELQYLYNTTPTNNSFVWTWYQHYGLL